MQSVANLNENMLKRQGAIISSMTRHERRNPKLIDGKRRRRIAAGSGTKVEDVNKLLKMHRQMADMMKSMGKNRGLMGKLFGGMGGGGGMPQPTPEQIEQLKKGQMPGGMGLPPGGLPKGLPGMPGLPGGGMKFPGFPGLPGKKK